MAELESAVDTALIKVTGLTEKVHETEEALERLDERSSRLLDDLTSEYESLREAVGRVTRTAAAERDRVRQEGDEAARALDEVGRAAQAAGEDCDQAAGETRREIVEVQETARGGEGRVGGASVSANEALTQLTLRLEAVERQLDEALAEAARVADGMSASLEAMQSDVRAQAAAVQVVLEDECTAEIDAALEAFDAGVDEVAHRLDADHMLMSEELRGTIVFAVMEGRTQVDKAYPIDCKEGAIVDAKDLHGQMVDYGSILDETHAGVLETFEESIQLGEQAQTALDTVQEEMASRGYL